MAGSIFPPYQFKSLYLRDVQTYRNRIMGLKLKHAVRAVWHHKYLWTLAAFLIIAGILDTNSFWIRYKLHKNNEKLKAEIQEYDEKYARDSRELAELQSCPEAVEKVARVRLFMKTADEDVYVIDETKQD